jgi:hypothetical protein
MSLCNDVRYALRLSPAGQEPGRLAGCIEHVISGRMHRFEDVASLVDWLQAEQAAAAQAAGRVPERAAGAGP